MSQPSSSQPGPQRMARTADITSESSCESAMSEAQLTPPSIYPPPPLDVVVRNAFPGRSLRLGQSPGAAWRALHAIPVRLWTAFLLVLAMGGSIFPVVVFTLDPGIPQWFVYCYAVVALVPMFLSLPVWLMLFLYEPHLPVVAEPPPYVNGRSTAVAVDILVTSYKEELDELAGTLAAIQNVVWKGPVNVYVLDDASRDDVANLCAGMHSARHPVMRITRLGNVGKKAGNVNNFLKTYERTADFFVILDCDMRPFPNMLQLLFGAYFDASERDRRRIGFITTPQFFRNYRAPSDHYDMLGMTWVNNIMPCMGRVHAAPFIGTNALWSRDAIERTGYFVMTMATEDVSTGCAVHTTDNADGHKFISKYLSLPVAAGLNPRTLKEIMDQRIRWNKGQCQMTAKFNGFLFNSQLRAAQRFVYFCTMAGWVRHIPTFLILWGGTIFFNISSAFGFVSLSTWSPPPLTIAAMAISIVLPTLPWLLLPGATVRARLRGIQMFFVYISTEIAGALAILGFDVPVLFASDSSAARWHPHFFFHAFVYLSIVGSGAFCAVWSALHRSLTPVPYVQAGFLVLLWSVAFFPIFRGIVGHENEEEVQWLFLEEGRAALYNKPVWAEKDNISFEQLKSVVVSMYQRIHRQNEEIKELQLRRQLIF